MTTPANLPLTIIKGLSYGPVIFNFKQADTTPFDLTGGWKAFAHARRTKDAVQKIDLAPQITDAAAGEVQIQFTDEQTLTFMGGEYGWDFLLESPDGIRLGPYFEGKLKITEVYTHT